ncbi:Aryl-phospho-beta-D-glucosidase BglH [Sphingopyxis sp. LC81]|uniref:family 1 glycosylhydrolase n=1 Tax=unclassified Sphingopyxis TaxID=2614943 RepID=UPI0005101CDD|nr:MULTISPECIES: family 1 glycosylhydrolase [unclassified Sphingopyxis]KGB53342.1 Aryl-phospho-beta-D-glucosidase BglH [Sphingopyxis sp. LC81]MDT7531266.1 family 1 glycosylhydrolase [Sphingopyxis sp. SE2]
MTALLMNGSARWPTPKSSAASTRHQFMFATGIENSYPVITGADGRTQRVDEMAKTGHYERWREDFALVAELGIEYLRYGPPYHLTHLGPGKYDWAFPDETFAELKRLNITPIVDLCHFGVPDWIGDFQNPDFPELFASYAGAFAERFPWVRLYTPVNEIFIAANFSAQLGWWNERLTSDRAFVTALKHLARANLLAEEAILAARGQAGTLFIQSESTEYFHSSVPEAAGRADFLNEKRFLSLDLCYGHDVRACMYQYLTDNGMSRQEYDWFMECAPRYKPFSIMGNDYYLTNEHMVSPGDGPVTASGEIFGYYIITKQYYDRYHLPVMHTETNLADAERAPDWLEKEWLNMLRLKQDGVPIVGFTWYSLIDQVDWDTALREDNGNVNALGLFDLDRKIRPVGEAYRELVKRWRDILPAESICLSAG